MREPLLPARGVSGGRSSKKGGMIDLSLNTQGRQETSDGSGNAGQGNERLSGATDSFVYHVAMSRQERTETTI